MIVLLLALAAADPTVEALEAPDGVKGLRAVFDVNAPPDVVLDTLWDVRRFRSIFPDVKSLEVLAPSAALVPTAAQLDVKFVVNAVVQETTYTLRREIDRAGRTIKWIRIAGDVPVIRGSWAVAPTANPAISRVTYTSYVDVGYFVPTGVVRDIAMGKVKEMATRVRGACKGASR